MVLDLQSGGLPTDPQSLELIRQLVEGAFPPIERGDPDITLYTDAEGVKHGFFLGGQLRERDRKRAIRDKFAPALKSRLANTAFLNQLGQQNIKAAALRKKAADAATRARELPGQLISGKAANQLQINPLLTGGEPARETAFAEQLARGFKPVAAPELTPSSPQEFASPGGQRRPENLASNFDKRQLLDKLRQSSPTKEGEDAPIFTEIPPTTKQRLARLLTRSKTSAALAQAGKSDAEAAVSKQKLEIEARKASTAELESTVTQVTGRITALNEQIELAGKNVDRLGLVEDTKALNAVLANINNWTGERELLMDTLASFSIELLRRRVQNGQIPLHLLEKAVKNEIRLPKEGRTPGFDDDALDELIRLIGQDVRGQFSGPTRQSARLQLGTADPSGFEIGAGPQDPDAPSVNIPNPLSFLSEMLSSIPKPRELGASPGSGQRIVGNIPPSTQQVRARRDQELRKQPLRLTSPRRQGFDQALGQLPQDQKTALAQQLGVAEPQIDAVIQALIKQFGVARVTQAANTGTEGILALISELTGTQQQQPLGASGKAALTQ